jgi:hypothetical protein
MNESRSSSDRDRNAADAEKYRLLQAKELLEALIIVEADDEKARAEAAAEPSADGDPDEGPSDDLSDGRAAAGPEHQVARLLEARDDGLFASHVFQDFGVRLDEFVRRIEIVLKNPRLDAGRRRALYERIAVSAGRLAKLADAVETDRGRGAR